MARQKKVVETTEEKKDQFTTLATLGINVTPIELTEDETEKVFDAKSAEEMPEIKLINSEIAEEVLVQCLPKTSGTILVGSKKWHYKGGEINVLPKNVKEILRSHGVLDAI